MARSPLSQRWVKRRGSRTAKATSCVWTRASPRADNAQQTGTQASPAHRFCQRNAVAPQWSPARTWSLAMGCDVGRGPLEEDPELVEVRGNLGLGVRRALDEPP